MISSSLDQKILNYVVLNLEKNVVKKIRDSNTLKSNPSNPHTRTIQIANVSQHAFAYKYSSKFGGESVVHEKKTKNSTALFKISTLDHACKTFKSSTISTFNSAGDIVIVTPWRYLASDMTVLFDKDKSCTFEKGKLAIPIKETADFVDLFFVCPGLDEDDNVPHWVRDTALEEIGLAPHPREFNDERGIGKICMKKADLDSTFLTTELELNDYDFIRVGSHYYQILGFCRHNNKLNSVRFTTDIQRNANNAPYGYICRPILQGNIARLLKSAVVEEQNVTMILNNIQSDDFHGTLNITFKNACFNKLGFLTHDTAILVP